MNSASTRTIRPERSPGPDLPGRYFAAGIAAFVLFAAGVPLLAPGTAVVPAFAAVLAASALVHVVDLALVLRTRRRRLGLEQWHTFASLAALLLSALLGLALATGRAPAPSWVVAYGYAALAGWFGFAIAGKSYKILPFLGWLQRYGEAAGRRPVPLMRDLVDERLAWASFGLLVAGFAGVLAGLLLREANLVRAAGGLYLLGALAFAANVARLALPLALAGRRPGTRREVAQ